VRVRGRLERRTKLEAIVVDREDDVPRVPVIPEAVGQRRSSVEYFMNALKLAIIGGGPSAFYVASRILKLLPSVEHQNIRVHLFDRLWAPHGLVRYGVAPDHPEVKASSLGLQLGKHMG
jgi:FAD-NAD(P)-binding